MDPYQAPVSSGENSLENPEKTGPRCPECGSVDTSVDSFLRPRLSILGVLFFGWYYLLVKGAFAVRTSLCRDCGARKRYKSPGSWIALFFLTVIVLIIAVAILEEYSLG